MNIKKQDEYDVKKQFTVIAITDSARGMWAVLDPMISLSNRLLYVSAHLLRNNQ